MLYYSYRGSRHLCDIAIIDMRQVTPLDATALTCFIQLRNRLRRSGGESCESSMANTDTPLTSNT
jgi:anti-anti-sigma regulatory factor